MSIFIYCVKTYPQHELYSDTPPLGSSGGLVESNWMQIWKNELGGSIRLFPDPSLSLPTYGWIHFNIVLWWINLVGAHPPKLKWWWTTRGQPPSFWNKIHSKFILPLHQWCLLMAYGASQYKYYHHTVSTQTYDNNQHIFKQVCGRVN